MYMQNVLAQAPSIKNDSEIVFPFAKDAALALIDTSDVGAVGARLLINPRHMSENL